MRQHDIAAQALTLEPSRRIHRRTEIIQPIVHRHGDARTGMQTDLDGQGLAAERGVELVHLVLDLEGGAHRVRGVAERRHHGVADRLDQRTVMLPHGAGEKGEMIAYQPIGRTVADPLVKRG